MRGPAVHRSATADGAERPVRWAGPTCDHVGAYALRTQTLQGCTAFPLAEIANTV